MRRTLRPASARCCRRPIRSRRRGRSRPAKNPAAMRCCCPISKIVSHRVTRNDNAGLRSFFDKWRDSNPSPGLGGSAIYAVTRDPNFLVKAIADWVESVNSLNQLRREFELTLLPGFRQALNFADDAPW